MCGIVGTFGQRQNGLEASLYTLEHRGPDGSDIKHLPNSTLGHTRLAIIDVEGGQQPLHNPAATRWLICNGEIYNHADLRDSLPDYPYETDSDSEVILALYEQYGTRAAEMLDGMFAFALIDGDDVYMARDPLGIKPLYYGWDGEMLHFGSEIKALKGKVETIEEFPPGHWFTTRDGLVKYYDLEKIGDEARKQKPASIADIRETLKKAVRKRLMSDVPVGVYLSGGLDSTIVATLVAQELPNVHSFAVGVEGSEDLKYAREAAKVIGTQHHECVYTEEEMIEALPEIIYHLESFDPLLVRSAIPNYFLARLTREYVTVVLTGEGADELYAGYHYLKEKSDLHNELVALTSTLYNCNLQRCDRMTMAHSIEGRVPFLDTEFIEMSFSVPLDQKIHGTVEKWALRKAFEGIVPDDVAWRVKEQFSKGAGSAHMMEAHAEKKYDDVTFAAEQARIEAETGVRIETKETLLCYHEYEKHFGQSGVSLVQLWYGQDVV